MATETAMERHQRKIKAMHDREAKAKAKKSKSKSTSKKPSKSKVKKKVSKKKKSSGHEDIDKIKSGVERRRSAMELLKIEMKKQGM